MDLACSRVSSGSALKFVASAIDQDRKSFTRHEGRLLNTQIILSKARNRYAPINRLLPPELLSHIFSLLLVGRHTPPREGLDYPTTLAGVCSSWRQLAIETRVLWGHIKICAIPNSGSLGNQLPRAGLHLDRAHGSPLHLELNEFWMSQEDREAAISLMRPHITNLRSLQYIVGNEDHAIIDCWLKYGTPGSLKNLSVIMLDDGTRLNFPKDLTFTALDEFLRPIQRLHLAGVWIDWNCAAFSSLVELALSNLQSGSLTTKKLARVLAASPQLESLELACVIIGRSRNTQIVPIRLEYLRKLSTFNLTPASFSGLLSVLTPCSSTLHLDLSGFSDTPPYLLDIVTDPICRYWSQVHISILRLSSIGVSDTASSSSRLHGLLATFPSIHTLDLFNFSFLNPLLEAIAGHTPDMTMKISARFHTVEFHQCPFESEEGFRGMVAAHPIQKLLLVECTVYCSDSWVKISEAKELCLWLASVVPDLTVENKAAVTTMVEGSV